MTETNNETELFTGTKRRFELVLKALEILAAHPEGMNKDELYAAVAAARIPRPEELEPVGVGKQPRFRLHIGWGTSDAVRAGWLTKDGEGWWRMTPEGLEAIRHFTDPISFRDEALRRANERGISAGGQQRLSEALAEILRMYCDARSNAPFAGNHPVVTAFQRLAQMLQLAAPVSAHPSLRVKASAGQGNWARVPWVAIMDERETVTTQSGVYCVFLFREDCSGVYLTLNQGVTRPQEELGAQRGKAALRERAGELRARLRALARSGFQLDDEVDLRSHQGLGAVYEVSTIAYKLYETDEIPSDEELIRDIDALVNSYEAILEVTRPEPPVTLAEVHAQFSSALREAHVSFGSRHEWLVRSFLASVLTKPFVILTGLSGSGKKQIALKFGEWLGQERLLMVPVRPDWTGPESLFGYPDILRNPDSQGRHAWSVPPALAFMLKAARDPSRPYLLVLDEMNLAHVERYFADFLSAVESGQDVLPDLTEVAGDWRGGALESDRLSIPKNLLVVGTVNVDETTYMFSPKVLDRANTLEFRVATDDLSQTPAKPTVATAASRGLAQALLAAATDDSWQESHPSPHLAEFVDR